MQLVLVIWRDAQSPQGSWHDLDAAEEQTPLEIWSIGWLVKDTKKFISIAQSRHADDGVHIPAVDNILVVPKGCIIRKMVLSREVGKVRDRGRSR